MSELSMESMENVLPVSGVVVASLDGTKANH